MKASIIIEEIAVLSKIFSYDWRNWARGIL